MTTSHPHLKYQLHMRTHMIIVCVLIYLVRAYLHKIVRNKHNRDPLETEICNYNQSWMD